MANTAPTVAKPGWRRLGGRGLLAGLACAVMVVAGCGTVPGSAAAIGDTTVSSTTIFDRVGEVVPDEAVGERAPTDEQWAQIARQQITDVIRHQLALLAAADRDIDVDDADVNHFIEQYEASDIGQRVDLADVFGVPAGAVADASYDFLVLQELIADIPADGVEVTNVTVNVDAVPAPDWSSAVADRVRYLDEPAAMATDAEAARAANPALPGGVESLLSEPTHAQFGIFSAREGEILLIPNGRQGYVVTRITDRDATPGTLTQAKISRVYQAALAGRQGPNLAAGIASKMAVASLLLGPYSEQVDVSVNPRFGQWDPRIVQVVASADLP